MQFTANVSVCVTECTYVYISTVHIFVCYCNPIGHFHYTLCGLVFYLLFPQASICTYVCNCVVARSRDSILHVCVYVRMPDYCMYTLIHSFSVFISPTVSHNPSSPSILLSSFLYPPPLSSFHPFLSTPPLPFLHLHSTHPVALHSRRAPRCPQNAAVPPLGTTPPAQR